MRVIRGTTLAGARAHRESAPVICNSPLLFLHRKLAAELHLGKIIRQCGKIQFLSRSDKDGAG